MPILGEQFFKISNTIFCYGLTPLQLAVYAYLVSCAGQKELCWPGMKAIAACCGCSKNAAREAIAVLAERGFIRKVERFKDYANGKSRQKKRSARRTISGSWIWYRLSWMICAG